MKSYKSFLIITIWCLLQCPAEFHPEKVVKQNETKASGSNGINQNKSQMNQPVDFNLCGKSSRQVRPLISLPPGVWPWMAAISYSSPNSAHQKFQCSAILISKQWVLTAAHCVQFTGSFKPEYVRLGDVELNDAADGTKHTDISIEKIIPHPEFSRNPIINDLALIRLKVPVNYTDNIRPICLLTQPKYEATKESYEYNKKFVNIIGYTYVQADGSTNHELKSWFTTIMNQTECNQRYATQRFALIDENLICIASSGKDTCEITMGGALFFENRTEHRFYLRGISSYGASCFLSNPPDVFTKVTHFVDWIVQVTGENFLF